MKIDVNELNNKKGRWVTMNGAHVFIEDEDAMLESARHNIRNISGKTQTDITTELKKMSKINPDKKYKARNIILMNEIKSGKLKVGSNSKDRWGW